MSFFHKGVRRPWPIQLIIELNPDTTWNMIKTIMMRKSNIETVYQTTRLLSITIVYKTGFLNPINLSQTQEQESQNQSQYQSIIIIYY